MLASSEHFALFARHALGILACTGRQQSLEACRLQTLFFLLFTLSGSRRKRAGAHTPCTCPPTHTEHGRFRGGAAGSRASACIRSSWGVEATRCLMDQSCPARLCPRPEWSLHTALCYFVLFLNKKEDDAKKGCSRQEKKKTLGKETSSRPVPWPSSCCIHPHLTCLEGIASRSI